MTRAKTMIETRTREHAWFHWLGKGCWALIEQGAFSAAGFLMNVVLIRWLTPHDYGTFTAVFTAFLLLSSLHTGLVVEPALVFGPGSYKDMPQEYLRGLLKGHWMVSAIEGAVLLLVGMVCLLQGATSLAMTFVAMAVAQAFIQLLWLMRQACYIHGAAGTAAVASLGYLALTLIGLWAVGAMGGGSVVCLTMVALSSLVAASWIYRQLGGLGTATDGQVWRDIVGQHWRFGRWGVASGALGLVPSALCYLVFPLYASLSQSGALKAMMVIVVPAHLANTAVSRLLLPQLVRRRGTGSFGRAAGLGAVALTLGPLLYWLALGLEHEKLIHVVYGGQFAEESSLLWLLGSAPLLGGIATLATAMLSAYERPSLVFFANAIAGVATMVVGAILCMHYGIRGAAWVSVLSNFWNVVCLGIFVMCVFTGGRARATPWRAESESRSCAYSAAAAEEQ